jgi:uncharacterized protein involved in exopolysaccharide biosynthesis
MSCCPPQGKLDPTPSRRIVPVIEPARRLNKRMSDQKPPKGPSASTPPPPYPGYPPYIVYPEEEPIDWRAYWMILVEHRKLIGMITLTGTLVALIAAFLTTPVYRAEVLLAPASQEKTGGLSALAGQFSDLAAVAGLNLEDKKNKTAENIAALKSRTLSTTFINQQSLKPVLFARKWDAEKKKWKDADDIPTDWDAFTIFDRDIRLVSVDRKTGLVTLTVDWKYPAQAAAWANSLVKHVNNRLRADAIEEIDKSIGFLEKQLAQTSSVEVQQAIYRLIEAETKNKMIASTREEYAFKVVDPAVPPEKKYRPRRALMVLVGLVLGLIVAVGTALALDRVRGQKTRSTE